MKISPLLLAALLATGSGAWAQVRDGSSAPGERAAAEGSADGRTVGEKVRGAADRAGDATRRAANRVKGESKEAARGAKKSDDRQAQKADQRPGERHPKDARHRGDTRAMGSPGRAMHADPEGSRRERMDQAYAHWKSQQGR